MKNSVKTVFSALALTAVAVSATSMAAFADEFNDFTQAEIEASATQPKVTISVESARNADGVVTMTPGGAVYELEDVAGKTLDVTLNVSGAAQKYCSTGFHIYYDKRLDVVKNPFGEADVKAGAALEYLTPNPAEDDPTASEQDMKGFFICTAGKDNYGLDGVMWTFKLQVPEDVKKGDVFPIDIIYKSNPNAEDLFVNKQDNPEGKLMQAYVFTKGIYNNSLNNNFAASADDVAKVKALANIDKSMDGYIAIADEPETTTTTVTTAATTTTTETTTAAPDVTTTASTGDVDTTASSTATGTATTTTTAKGTTTTTKPSDKDSPKTGVAGAGVAVAGLAVALGTAFVLRKKED